jgi:hypothetical protein
MFGAHFPLDTVAGTALGTASAIVVAIAFERKRPIGAKPEPMIDDAVVAVMPSHNDVPEHALVQSVLEHVDALVLVDDGSDAPVARELDALAAEYGLEFVRLPARGGKGSAVRAGVDHVRDRYAAVLVIDADGQHPASAIPAFLEAAREAEVVIGDRFDDLDEMPFQRRLANRATRRLFQLVTGREVRDTQNGMRLLRGRALELLPAGGYEAETAHLRRVLGEGRAVAWVPIPAIYGAEQSSFRPVLDSARVLWALVRPLEPRAQRQHARQHRAPLLQTRPVPSGRRGTPATTRRRQPLRATAA